MDRKETQQDEALLKVTEAIVANFKLRNGYDPNDFKNPVLQKYYNTLHDYLLQQEKNTKSGKNLKKLKSVRDRIVASSQSTDATKQKLSKLFEVWNQLYESMESRNSDSASTKRVKKDSFNL